jgi:hypothetical protein
LSNFRPRLALETFALVLEIDRVAFKAYSPRLRLPNFSFALAAEICAILRGQGAKGRNNPSLRSAFEAASSLLRLNRRDLLPSRTILLLTPLLNCLSDFRCVYFRPTRVSRSRRRICPRQDCVIPGNLRSIRCTICSSRAL